MNNEMNSSLTARECYEKKKIKLTVFGLLLSWFSSLSLVIFQNFNLMATEIIKTDYDNNLISGFVLTLITVSFCEYAGALIMIVYNTITGIPFAEYGRVWQVRSSRTILLSAIFGGPVATTCSMLGISLCGSTYGNCVIGLTPVLTAVLGTIFLKEKTGIRVIVGIVISVAGATLASIAPPAGVKNFYLGLIIVAFAPIGYSLEAIISTHAVDVSEPRVVCPLYRMIGGATIEMALAFTISLVTGHWNWMQAVFSVIFSDGTIMVFLLITAFFMCIQYNSIYSAYNYSGATRSSAILFSSPIWTIPIGIIMSRAGVMTYSVTMLGTTGAVVIVIGIIIVLAKPSELFNLRDVGKDEEMTGYETAN